MSKITLCIIEECILNQITYKRIFEDDENFTILAICSSANECLAALKDTQADILILSTEVFSTKDFRLIRQIKENFLKTKIIAVTSRQDENTILSLLSCNVNGYILKDNISRLKNVASIVLSGAFWMDSKVAKKIFSLLPNLDYSQKVSASFLKENLTKRELEVLRLMIEGKTNSQIAKEIIVSVNTAKAHVASILTKLSAKDRVQAAVKEVRANLFQG